MEPFPRGRVCRSPGAARGGRWNSTERTLLTLEATRWRAIGQILLLTAGLLVLVAISALSVVLVNQARKDNAWVVHTVEVENQIDSLLLQVRRAESASRGYLLTSEPRFLAETKQPSPPLLRMSTSLTDLTSDNPVQIENSRRLRAPVEARLAEFAKAIDFVKRNDVAGGVAMLRQAGASETVGA